MLFVFRYYDAQGMLVIKLSCKKDNWWDKIKNFISWWWPLIALSAAFCIGLYFSLPYAGICT